MMKRSNAETAARKLLVAHRGNTTGPTKFENTFSFLVDALNDGFSVEVDLRSDRERLYLSHDPGSIQVINSWENFIREVKKLLPSWKDEQPWDEAGFTVPRIWVDWKEPGISIVSVLSDLVGELGFEALAYFIFIDLELVYTPEVARRMAGLLGGRVPLGWRRSNLDGEGEQHIKDALLLRDQVYNDWIWVDDMRDNLLTPWWLSPVENSLVFSEASDLPGTGLFTRKALVAPDLHKVPGAESVAILSGMLDANREKKVFWVDAICSDYVDDAVLVESMTSYVGRKAELNAGWRQEL